LLNLEKAISLKDLRRMKSEQWMSQLDQLEYSFETNNTKEAFALSKQIAQIKNNSPVIRGFEEENGTAILEDHLINDVVEKHYSKLLFDEKAGKIQIKEIDEF
jgi:hypothetical protein